MYKYVYYCNNKICKHEFAMNIYSPAQRVFEAPGLAVHTRLAGPKNHPVEWPLGVSSGRHGWAHTECWPGV